MSFNCPECHTKGVLKISHSIELPPDARSDEIALQLVVCSEVSCGFRGAAIYEESRRGALDTDHWDHTGYRISSEVFDALSAVIGQCHDPSNASCQCQTHQVLGRTSSAGRWQPPEGIEWGSAFLILK